MKLQTNSLSKRVATLPPERWFAVRAALEDRYHLRRQKYLATVRYDRWRMATTAFRFALKMTGLYGWGVRNALDVQVREFELGFADLPTAFDGYRILHLTDLHFDRRHNPGHRLAAMVAEIEADICLMTGDYRYRRFGPIDDTVEAMALLAEALHTPDGTFATLGNHDSVAMVEPFAELGIRVLANETLSLHRNGMAMHLTGIDDVHSFYTRDADRAIAMAPEGFRIALVHSPEFALPAANAGIALYLSGHTHGGQVCLPGARPILTNVYGCTRDRAIGLWRHGAMTGYTSYGAGASVVPVRFNCRGEVTIITLRRTAA